MTDGHDPEAAVASLRGQGVKAIRLLYTDLHGVARGKDIPIGHFVELLEEGVAFCSVIMGTDLRHTPVVGGEQGYVDFAVRPDPETLRIVPWQPEVAWCLGEAWTLDGSDHWPSCPRALLAPGRRAATRARGLAPVVGPELEWFLCKRDPTAPNGLGRYVDELSRVYTVGAISDPLQINLRTLLWADELGLKAFAGNHEFMNSQYEINLKHSAALDAADRAFMLKAAVKEVAAHGGAPRDVHGAAVHRPGRLGLPCPPVAWPTPRAATRSPPTTRELSPLGLHFVGGVIAHAQGLQALLGPTVNAYKRILPDSLAPTHANWGHDNRTAFCRVPNERGSRTRVEIRTGDGSACPHLIIAALLLAGLDGIERELEPPEPVVGDAYRMDDAHAGTKLPGDLGAALDALEADTWLVERARRRSSSRPSSR